MFLDTLISKIKTIKKIILIYFQTNRKTRQSQCKSPKIYDQQTLSALLRKSSLAIPQSAIGRKRHHNLERDILKSYKCWNSCHITTIRMTTAMTNKIQQEQPPLVLLFRKASFLWTICCINSISINWRLK